MYKKPMEKRGILWCFLLSSSPRRTWIEIFSTCTDGFKQNAMVIVRKWVVEASKSNHEQIERFNITDGMLKISRTYIEQ